MVDCYKNTHTLLKLKNKDKGSDLKDAYMKKNNLAKNKITLRFIYKGFEIKDDTYLYANKFEKENYINVLLRYNSVKFEQGETEIPKKILGDTFFKPKDEEEEKQELGEGNDVDVGPSQQTLNIKIITAREEQAINIPEPLHRWNSTEVKDTKKKVICDEKKKSY